MLDRKMYKALEKLLGPENISEDPAVRTTYSYQWCVEVDRAWRGESPTRFGHLPAAVVLPKTPEEVQGIVRLCNEHGVKFKALSTGFGAWNAVSSPEAIQIDLRRMNQIIEINKDNMYAVVEPYVTNAQLHSQLIKYGLMHHMQGAGPQTSPLASHTSMVGPGFTSSATGFSGRNVRAVEWVIPTGDILRLGSLTSSDAWFSGDGPGPSLRGVMRGLMGAMGGLGIFTKVAIKLYPWPGPPDWRVSGTIPNYEFEVPPFWKMYVINWPDWDAFEAGYYQIAEANVAMMAMSSSQEGLATMFCNTREETIEKILQPAFLNAVQRYAVVLVTAHTKREFNYRTKVIQTIIKDSGGVDLIETGVVTPPSNSYAEGIRNMLGSHAFRFTSCFQSTHGGMDTITMSLNIAKINHPIKLRYIEKKVIGNDRGEGLWITYYEQGHFAHMEIPTVYDPSSPESCQGYADYAKECNDVDIQESLGIPFFIVGDAQHELYGPHTSNYHIWLRKIKTAFDPRGVSDPGHYISREK